MISFPLPPKNKDRLLLNYPDGESVPDYGRTYHFILTNRYAGQSRQLKK